MNIYIFAFIIIIMIIVAYFLYNSKSNYPSITPIPTIPKPTTKYLLTEQAIMLTFPGNYSTPYDRDIYSRLLNTNINRSILKTYPNSSPFNLNCYVLHTPVFLPDPINIQGKYFDQNTGEVIDNSIENQEYFDIIGAYFFINFKYLLNNTNDNDPNDPNDNITYYDTTKQIIMNSTDLFRIFTNLNADSSNNQSVKFSKGKRPSSLDEFVPKISMFLFYGLGINDISRYVYRNMLTSC